MHKEYQRVPLLTKPLIILAIVTIVVLILFGFRSPKIENETDIEANIVWNLSTPLALEATQEADGLCFALYRLTEEQVNYPYGFAVYGINEDGTYAARRVFETTETTAQGPQSQAVLYTPASSDADAPPPQSYLLAYSWTEGVAEMVLTQGETEQVIPLEEGEVFFIVPIQDTETPWSCTFRDAQGNELASW